MERKFPKFEEWYANANDIVACFFISGKKSGENLHEHTFMHHDHHPISIVFPLQLPNTIFILWFSLYRNKQIFITFLPPPLPSHVYWSVKHKAKTWAILFRIFSKIKKAEFRTYFVCSHTFSYKIQMQTKFHRAWAPWDLIRLWLCGLHVCPDPSQIFQMITILLVWQSRNFILKIYQLITAKSIIT